MSWRDAPLYVEAHDLARWVLERAASWPPERDRLLAPPLAAAACDLVTEVALALTFPHSRARHLERADHAIVRVRTLLRLARDLALISAGGLRFAAGRLQVIGRMVGGWRKRVERRDRQEVDHNEIQGTGRQRREARDPRWQLLERGTERAVGVPEQERPEDSEREPGLPRVAPRRPEPAAGPVSPRPRAGPSPAVG